MNPAHIWTWIDALDTIKDENGDYEGIGEWGSALFEEITQGRGIIAHVHIEDGLSLAKDNKHVRIYGCIFTGGEFALRIPFVGRRKKKKAGRRG